MSYIIKTYNGDNPLYFHRLCRRVYQDRETPAFREDIDDAYVFDTKERAYRMMAMISERYPEVHLELEEAKNEETITMTRKAYDMIMNKLYEDYKETGATSYDFFHVATELRKRLFKEENT